MGLWSSTVLLLFSGFVVVVVVVVLGVPLSFWEFEQGALC